MTPCYPHQLKQFPLTKEERVAIWKYAKDAYIDKGVDNIHTTVHGVANDLGLRPEWVLDAFTKDKNIRNVSDELYRQMSARRKAIQNARAVVADVSAPGWLRFAKRLYRTPFALAVTGHGTVGLQTHGGGLLFRPDVADHYWSNFRDQFKYFANPKIHEKALQELERRPLYTEAQRAGLVNDPNRVYAGTYEQYAQWLPQWMRGMGKRGFDTLKILRQDLFEHYWEKIPESIKADPEQRKLMAENIAEMVNHSTGASSGHLTDAVARTNILFAAKLEASRWRRVIGDPIETIKTGFTWKNASAADRHLAIMRTRNAAIFVGTYVSSLAINQALLRAGGSPVNINFTDPSKRDWLTHKIGPHVLGLEGGLLTPIRFIAQLIYSQWEPNKFQKRDKPFGRAVSITGNYLRSKLQPFYSSAVDLETGRDFANRPLPWSSEKPSSSAPRYTPTEYAISKGPIPLSGLNREIYDTWREQGMSAFNASNLIRYMAILGGEITGAKVSPEPKR